MKINRLRLLTMIDEQIAQRQRAQDRRRAEAAENNRHSRERAMQLNPHWEELARRILDAVIDDQPVSIDLVPVELRSGYSDSLRFFKPARELDDTDVASDLRALKLFLEATLDEDVNTTSLERQGFALGRVIRGHS